SLGLRTWRAALTSTTPRRARYLRQLRTLASLRATEERASLRSWSEASQARMARASACARPPSFSRPRKASSSARSAAQRRRVWRKPPRWRSRWRRTSPTGPFMTPGPRDGRSDLSPVVALAANALARPLAALGYPLGEEGRLTFRAWLGHRAGPRHELAVG